MPSKQELDGLRVLVTRSSDQAGSLTNMLTAKGALVIELPVIAFKDPPSWEPLDGALRSIEEYDWIIFASSNAVAKTANRAKELNLWASFKNSRAAIASIGSATSKRLSKEGLIVSFQPSSYVAEALVEQFPNKDTLVGKRVLWPKTDIGRTLIADQLSALGARVDIVHAYSTGIPDNARELGCQLVKLLIDGDLDVITLASSQTARNLELMLRLGAKSENTEKIPIDELLSDTHIASIGPITSKTAEKILKSVEIEAEEYTLEGMLQAILEWHQRRAGTRDCELNR